MLKNYFKIAFRNIFRNKVYSFINVAGLTLGITCSSMLLMLVIDELSFDDMHTKKDQIYRVVEIDDTEKDTRYYGQTAPPVASALKAEYPEVVDFTRLFKLGGQFVFQKEDVKFDERDYFFVEPSFFDVFDITWLAGDRETALNEPFSIILDEDHAKALFGSATNAINQQVRLGDNQNAVITGVFKGVPDNTHLQFRLLASMPQSDDMNEYMQDWGSYGAYTYLVLDEKADESALAGKIPDFVSRHFEEEQNRNFYLQPMEDIHFYSDKIEYAVDSNRGQISYVYVFSAIGLFMIIIACINYMNLATAKAMHRGKEIGIRKVSGAVRTQLIMQFLTESTFIALLSLVLSIGLVDLLLPYFNQLTDKSFEFTTETFGGIFSLLFILTLLVGLLSGSYPAIMLSRLRAANILKGQMTTGKGSVRLRQVLVITQFTLSIIMIIATVITSRQLHYMQNKSLGFNKDQMLVVDINSGNVRAKFETLKNEFSNSPYVKGVAVSSRVPGEWKNIRQIYTRKVGDSDSLRVNFMGFDESILDLYQIELAAGKNFIGSVASDSSHILVNETAVEALGLEDPLGAYIELSDGQKGNFQIVGIVKDFNFQSLHKAIEPVILGFRSNPFQSIDYFSLKFDPAHTEEVVAHATEVHNAFDTGSPIEYHFLDQQWDQFYKNDQRAGKVFAVGAGITIFIACLGLFGLASFIIQKRTKEIGVRKVLGASSWNLFFLLSKTFTLQVLLSFLIAAPIAWYFMSQWLDNFAFRFEMGLLEFLVAGVAALLIALLSISYRVVKATGVNPASTLKDE